MFKPILCVLAVGLLAGCATNRQETVALLPPINASATMAHNPGQVIWHDLATRDLEVSKHFYSGLFGWRFQQLNDEGRLYTSIYLNDTLIGGMFRFEADEKPNAFGEWLVNISSGDVAGDAAKFVRAGGEVLEPVREVPDRGVASFVRDPYEAVMILTKSSSGDPVEGEVPVGSWLWNELWTTDAEGALGLYQDVFGYESKEVDGGNDRPYFLLEKDGVPLAGLLELKATDVRPHWVPFVRVSNVRSTVSKAIELGGTVLIEPQEDIREGKVALLQGPTGEPVVVQEFEFSSN